MKIKDILFSLQNRIEAQLARRIYNPEISEKIGVSTVTYKDYLSGKTEPLAMKALLKMMNMIENDEELIKIIRDWSDKNEKYN